MDKNFEFIKLSRDKFPEPEIQRKLARMHVKNGCIYDTYKSLVENQTIYYKGTDIIYDKVENWWAFYAVNNKQEIIGWCLIIKGKIEAKDKQSYYIAHYYTKPSCQGSGLGTAMFAESVKKAKRGKSKLLVYPCNSNKWFFKKMRDKFPEVEIENVYNFLKLDEKRRKQLLNEIKMFS